MSAVLYYGGGRDDDKEEEEGKGEEESEKDSYYIHTKDGASFSYELAAKSGYNLTLLTKTLTTTLLV